MDLMTAIKSIKDISEMVQSMDQTERVIYDYQLKTIAEKCSYIVTTLNGGSNA